MKDSKEYEPEIDDPFAALAQGVINIDSGYTNIEKDSYVYRGMLELIKLRHAGRLVLKEEK